MWQSIIEILQLSYSILKTLILILIDELLSFLDTSSTRRQFNLQDLLNPKQLSLLINKKVLKVKVVVKYHAFV